MQRRCGNYELPDDGGENGNGGEQLNVTLPNGKVPEPKRAHTGPHPRDDDGTTGGWASPSYELGPTPGPHLGISARYDLPASLPPRLV